MRKEWKVGIVMLFCLLLSTASFAVEWLYPDQYLRNHLGDLAYKTARCFMYQTDITVGSLQQVYDRTHGTPNLTPLAIDQEVDVFKRIVLGGYRSLETIIKRFEEELSINNVRDEEVYILTELRNQAMKTMEDALKTLTLSLPQREV